MTPHPKPHGPRIARTISIRPDQDRWLVELLGDGGNFSGLVQSLLDSCRQGEIPVRRHLGGAGNYGAAQRAEAYLKAKEAGMLFEEDVGLEIARWVSTRRSAVRVSKGRIHNGSGTTFVADYSVEGAADGAGVLASVVCKSSVRPDKLQLALAEAMIGRTKTGKPVITVVPYLTTEVAEVAGQFVQLGYALTPLAGLSDALTKVAIELANARGVAPGSGRRLVT